ncbi:hypothetical protein HMN09_00370200 [Mycena chlorophos]|uniref:Uncharacterized protein n=1 Tax=Mycena chlorophos TaxID=658473 RepID=A0A8H6TMW5_MYCCL|nr:hypothetical protein HMN09_00370200 [Mycena chlorophos]
MPPTPLEMLLVDALAQPDLVCLRAFAVGLHIFSSSSATLRQHGHLLSALLSAVAPENFKYGRPQRRYELTNIHRSCVCDTRANALLARLHLQTYRPRLSTSPEDVVSALIAEILNAALNSWNSSPSQELWPSSAIVKACTSLNMVDELSARFIFPNSKSPSAAEFLELVATIAVLAGPVHAHVSLTPAHYVAALTGLEAAIHRATTIPANSEQAFELRHAFFYQPVGSLLAGFFHRIITSTNGLADSQFFTMLSGDLGARLRATATTLVPFFPADASEAWLQATQVMGFLTDGNWVAHGGFYEGWNSGTPENFSTVLLHQAFLGMKHHRQGRVCANRACGNVLPPVDPRAPHASASRACTGCGWSLFCNLQCQTNATNAASYPHSTACNAIHFLRNHLKLDGGRYLADWYSIVLAYDAGNMDEAEARFVSRWVKASTGERGIDARLVSRSLHELVMVPIL